MSGPKQTRPTQWIQQSGFDHFCISPDGWSTASYEIVCLCVCTRGAGGTSFTSSTSV